MRLIDADKIDFGKVFIGASDFARDTRNEAQELIDMQPTAYEVDKIIEQIKKAGNENGEVIIDYVGAEMISKQRVIDIIRSGKKEGDVNA